VVFYTFRSSRLNNRYYRLVLWGNTLRTFDDVISHLNRAADEAQSAYKGMLELGINRECIRNVRDSVWYLCEAEREMVAEKEHKRKHGK